MINKIILSRFLLPCLILSLYTVSFGQSKEVKHLIDTSLFLVKQHSVNTRKVNWKDVEREIAVKSANITDPYELGPVMRYLFESLDDFHGYFNYHDSIFKLPYRGPKPSDSVISEWKKGISIKTEILSRQIGYLRIPFMSYDGKEGVDKKAQTLNDSLCSLLDKNVKGLIIDLRLNGGGAMFPMILGISSVLDTGKIGSFTSGGAEWFIRDRNFLLDTTVLTSLKSMCADARHLPVAVLIGSGTGSSGEFVAISLKTRDKTRFIGSKTAGYVTSIKGFDIAPNIYVHISTGYGADKNGYIYKDSIVPDEFVDDPDNFNDLPNDGKVKAAIKWFTTLPARK